MTSIPIEPAVAVAAAAATPAQAIAAVLGGWDRIEDHRTGTTGDRATAEWLAAEFAVRGVPATLEEFPFRRRVVRSAWVDVGAHRIEGLPCFDGGLTGPEGVAGRLTDLAGPGEIGVTEFQPSGSPDLTDARHAGRHAAIVAVAAGHPIRPGLAVINADAYDAPFGPPVLQVATEHRETLTAALAGGATARVVVDAASEDVVACNVGAVVEGSRPELAPLVVMTPRSGWWRCTSERGGGLVVLLECARHFAALRPERTVIFTANTGHELGHIGLDAFFANNPDLATRAHAWVHLGANFAAQGARLRVQASDVAWLETLQRGLATRGLATDATPVGTRPLGEARNVFDRGGRYVSILATNPLFHHPDDRLPDAIDLATTAATTEALVEMAVALVRG